MDFADPYKAIMFPWNRVKYLLGRETSIARTMQFYQAKDSLDKVDLEVKVKVQMLLCQQHFQFATQTLLFLHLVIHTTKLWMSLTLLIRKYFVMYQTESVAN